MKKMDYHHHRRMCTGRLRRHRHAQRVTEKQDRNVRRAQAAHRGTEPRDRQLTEPPDDGVRRADAHTGQIKILNLREPQQRHDQRAE